MILINNSSEPIIINGLSIKLNNSFYPCYDLPRKIFSSTNTTGSVTTFSKDFYSMALPINFSPAYGTSGYFAFDIPQEDMKKLSTEASILVSSNRGKAFEIQLKLEREVDWHKMY